MSINIFKSEGILPKRSNAVFAIFLRFIKIFIFQFSISNVHRTFQETVLSLLYSPVNQQELYKDIGILIIFRTDCHFLNIDTFTFCDVLFMKDRTTYTFSQ
ncbi:hypothetical protein CW304_21875 [Bacillus sp. UFRGS-B20]|nr:hypothetical protein CW304_21875 [Bacillus sp. UFRGS-B20]